MNELYDVAIVGTGPAGYTAAVYASRYGMKNVIFGKLPGGTMSEAHKICNYPSYSEISGLDLSTKMYEQVQRCGTSMVFESVKDVKKNSEGIFEIVSEKDTVFLSKSVIIATGTKRRQLALPDEAKFIGRGVSYCATCDAAFFKQKIVAVIGGSNAATTAALLLSEHASKVYIIYRGTELKGEQVWIDQVKSRENIEVVYTTVVTGLHGSERLESISLSRELNGSKELVVDGLFVEIGSDPNSDLPVNMGLEVNSSGYVVVKGDQSTNIEGIFAAGDLTTNSNMFQQVVTACGEGAVAANSAYKYINL